MTFRDIADEVFHYINKSQSENAAVEAVLNDMYDQIERALDDLARDYPDVEMPDVIDVRNEIQHDYFDELDI